MQDLAQSGVRNLPTKTLVLHHEIIIDRPVRDVWPELFNYNTWNPQHIGAKVERVAGQPGNEGEIILESKKSGDGYLPPIVIETVKVVPFKQLVWKMYKPQETPEITFVDFSLDEVGNTTRFVYNSYGEILEERFEGLPDPGEYHKILLGIFGALKKFVEAR